VADAFATGRIVIFILALMLLELIVLIIVRKKTGRGLTTGALIVSLAAGAALLLALRSALTGQPWQSVAPWLIIALAAHVLDLKLRWPSR
jgi:UPF0716 family protein affecting phage T7 exclusion